MAVIGNSPATTGTTVSAQSFNGDNSTVAFTLSRSVNSTVDLEVLVDNVQQSPYDSSYSVSGTTLTFSSAPATGTNNIYVIYRGATIATAQVIPDDGSVSTAKLQDNSVTTAKINGNIATSIAPQMPYIQWVLASNSAALSSDTTLTDMTITASRGITESSGTFTISESGLYLISFNLTARASDSERQFGAIIDVNGTTVSQSRDQVSYLESNTSYGSCSVTYIGLLSASDNVYFRAQRSYSDGTIIAYVEQTSGGIVKVGN